MSALEVVLLVLATLFALRLLAAVYLKLFGKSDEQIRQEAEMVADSDDPDALRQWLRTGKLPQNK